MNQREFARRTTAGKSNESQDLKYTFWQTCGRTRWRLFGCFSIVKHPHTTYANRVIWSNCRWPKKPMKPTDNLIIAFSYALMHSLVWNKFVCRCLLRPCADKRRRKHTMWRCVKHCEKDRIGGRGGTIYTLRYWISFYWCIWNIGTWVAKLSQLGEMLANWEKGETRAKHSCCCAIAKWLNTLVRWLRCSRMWILSNEADQIFSWENQLSARFLWMAKDWAFKTDAPHQI